VFFLGGYRNQRCKNKKGDFFKFLIEGNFCKNQGGRSRLLLDCRLLSNFDLKENKLHN
jgi:hypothetical protein